MKRIILLLTSLIIILAVLLVIWNRSKAAQTEMIIIQNESEQTISYAKFSKMTKSNFTSKRGDEFSGILLTALLKDYSYNYLILHSSDGGSLRLNEEDIPNSYIIEMAETDKKSYRLIIPADEFGQRWMKYLHKIELH